MNYVNASPSRSVDSIMDKCDAAICARRPVSTEVMDFANDLAARAACLAEDVHAKLHPVMNAAPPTGEGLGVVREVYPPYFQSLRDHLVKIEGALNAIQDALSRTEL